VTKQPGEEETKQSQPLGGSRGTSVVLAGPDLCVCREPAKEVQIHQVRLFRDDWLRNVRRKRAAVSPIIQQDQEELKWRIRYATEIAEIYLEQKDYQSLAFHYAALNEEELRDKYVERAIEAGADDEFVCFFRHLQGKPIPAEIVEREIKRLTSERDVLNRARLYGSVLI
jgi:hypothetical protein